MSVTIVIGSTRAVIANGRWRSIDKKLCKLLNLFQSSLRIPGHYPPIDRELASADEAAEFFGGRIVSIKPLPDEPTETSDGYLIIF